MFAFFQIDPPLGFGSKCPDLLAYKRLVRMNMPVDEEGKVHFKSTLFSLIRINLQIFMRSMEEMDQADQELRAAIQKSWPSTRGGGRALNSLSLFLESPVKIRVTNTFPAVFVDIITSLEVGLSTKRPSFGQLDLGSCGVLRRAVHCSCHPQHSSQHYTLDSAISTVQPVQCNLVNLYWKWRKGNNHPIRIEMIHLMGRLT